MITANTYISNIFIIFNHFSLLLFLIIACLLPPASSLLHAGLLFFLQPSLRCYISSHYSSSSRPFQCSRPPLTSITMPLTFSLPHAILFHHLYASPPLISPPPHAPLSSSMLLHPRAYRSCTPLASFSFVLNILLSK